MPEQVAATSTNGLFARKEVEMVILFWILMIHSPYKSLKGRSENYIAIKHPKLLAVVAWPPGNERTALAKVSAYQCGYSPIKVAKRMSKLQLI